MFNQLVIIPISQTLLFFYHLLGDNLGLSIIATTLLIRVILIPLTLPSLKSASKIKDLKPELDELKKKHASDKQALQQAQLKLYQQHNINPAAGCLPYIVQFIVLIGLYRVFIDLLQSGSLNGSSIKLHFGWFNLGQPDPYYALPILAGLTQLILALMISPATATAAEKTLATSTKSKADDKQAEDMEQMAQTMQQQMVYMMPLMTVFIALKFPSGLSLYWVITTLFSILQQYFVSGLGGLSAHLKKLKIIK